MNKQEIQEKILDAAHVDTKYNSLQELEDAVVAKLKKLLSTCGLEAWGIVPFENDTKVEIVVYYSFQKPNWNKTTLYVSDNEVTASNQ